MAAWLIRVTAKRRKEIDKDLLVQAVLALGRQLREQERQAQDGPSAIGGEPSAETGS